MLTYKTKRLNSVGPYTWPIRINGNRSGFELRNFEMQFGSKPSCLRFIYFANGVKSY